MNKGDEPEFAQQSIQHYDGGMCYAVSTTCPDIEAACRYLDWRFSEEGLMTMITWFTTFMVISVAQFLVWILATETVVRIVKRQTNEVYSKALNILVQSYDNSMESVRSMLNVMSLDKDIPKSIDGSGDVWQNEITRRRLASYKSQYSGAVSGSPSETTGMNILSGRYRNIFSSIIGIRI